MRILLFGKNGQLGWELQRSLHRLGKIVAVDQDELDLRESDRVVSFIRDQKPTIIINSAAYTDVDRAESEPDIAAAVNAYAPGIMAREAIELGAVLIHFSTDYVFDGSSDKPYSEEVTPNPINEYGRTKWEGEKAVQAAGGKFLIFRTSWLYSMRGSSFPNKVLKWAREKEVLRIVDDQVGNPTWARMLADITAHTLEISGQFSQEWMDNRWGVYHVSGRGSVNRFEWAKAILEFDPKSEEHIYLEIMPAKSEDFPTPATRPKFSSLNVDRFERIFDVKLSDWKDTLQLAMQA